MSTIEKTSESIEVLEKLIKDYEIIIYNDDVNTFDFVIDALIDVCDHEPIQAEQCTMLIHYKGKCAVKTGSYEDLKPRCSKLLELGLSAEIQ
ncbi:ATP-dependent Clp protease adaptor ClpS [Wenyingzhuangia sp. IMCC45533]